MKDGESGFILMTAIWLLILCAAIVSLVMLRNLHQARDMKALRSDAQLALDLESAIDTVMAERLFEGERSRWWRVPANGTIDLDGRPIAISITSEAGKIDINEADPLLIDQALLGLGTDGGRRTNTMAQLRALRSARKRIENHGDMVALMGDNKAVEANQPCLSPNFTLVSGLSKPRESQMPPALATALGVRSPPLSEPPPPGTALHTVARTEKGARLVVVFRPVGTRDDFAAISRWERSPDCD